MEKGIVVTGANSGIGRETILLLNKKGFFVFAIGHTKAIEELTVDIPFPEKMISIKADLTSKKDLENILHRISESGVPIHGIVNNAGIMISGPLQFLPENHFRKQIEINLIAVFNLTQKLLPAIIKNKGKIIQISSLSGKKTSKYLGGYSATKFALEAYSIALKQELENFGVTVTIIYPQLIRTNLFERNEFLSLENYQNTVYYNDLFKIKTSIKENLAKNGLNPSIVAEKILTVINSKNPKFRYYIMTKRFSSILLRLLDKFM
jgi:short-subunit dehydrogenase